MVRGFKYRLYPTAQQEEALCSVFIRLRALYNAALQQRQEAWERITISHADARGRRKGKALSFYEQCIGLTELRREMPEWQELPVIMARDSLRRVDLAFKAFFRRCAAGQPQGFPRFKGRDQYNTLCVAPGDGGKLLDSGRRIYIAGVGNLRVRLHRPYEGTCKQIKITRDGAHWYVSLICADVPARPLPATGAEVGIDLGVKVFAAMSDGRTIENPRPGDELQKAISRAARTVARRQKGSQNRRDAVERLRALYAKARRQRADFHHKVALDLLREHDRVAVEDLRVKNLTRSARGTAEAPGVNVRQKAGLNRAILDAAPGAFLDILEAKAETTGRTVVRVNPAGTSQQCSGCGAHVPKPLNERTHRCASCGLVLDRDVNAARNILALGRSAWGAEQ